MKGLRQYASPLLLLIFSGLGLFVALPLMDKYGVALVMGVEIVIAVVLVAGYWWWGKRQERP
jgi:hypothetical protein